MPLYFTFSVLHVVFPLLPFFLVFGSSGPIVALAGSSRRRHRGRVRVYRPFAIESARRLPISAEQEAVGEARFRRGRRDCISGTAQGEIRRELTFKLRGTLPTIIDVTFHVNWISIYHFVPPHSFFSIFFFFFFFVRLFSLTLLAFPITVPLSAAFSSRSCLLTWRTPSASPTAYVERCNPMQLFHRGETIYHRDYHHHPHRLRRHQR